MAAQPAAREYLGVEEFAELIGVSPQTVYKWTRRGQSPAMPRFAKLANGRIITKRIWVDAWLDELAHSDTAEPEGE